MTLGELKAYLETCELPDHAEVLIQGKYGFLRTEATEFGTREMNQYGQVQGDVNAEPDALVFIDKSTG